VEGGFKFEKAVPGGAVGWRAVPLSCKDSSGPYVRLPPNPSACGWSR